MESLKFPSAALSMYRGYTSLVVPHPKHVNVFIEGDYVIVDRPGKPRTQIRKTMIILGDVFNVMHHGSGLAFQAGHCLYAITAEGILSHTFTDTNLEVKQTPCGMLYINTYHYMYVYPSPGITIDIRTSNAEFVHWVAPRTCIIGYITYVDYAFINSVQIITIEGDTFTTSPYHHPNPYSHLPALCQIGFNSVVTNGNLLTLATDNNVTTLMCTPEGYIYKSSHPTREHDGYYHVIGATNTHIVSVRTDNDSFTARVHADGKLLCERTFVLLPHGKSNFTLIDQNIVAINNPQHYYTLFDTPLPISL
jgi:hypothetical protein